MSKLMINDLPASAELDRAAAKDIVGGLSLGWIQPFIKQQGGNFGGTTFNFFDIDYNVFQQNPTNININNLGGESSAMLNEITVTPINVNAASPTAFVGGD